MRFTAITKVHLARALPVALKSVLQCNMCCKTIHQNEAGELGTPGHADPQLAWSSSRQPQSPLPHLASILWSGASSGPFPSKNLWVPATDFAWVFANNGFSLFR